MSRRSEADAHHELLSHAPIKQRGRVVGFKATVVLDPNGYTANHPTLGGNVRLGLGSMKYLDQPLGAAGMSDRQRDAGAGVQPGYLLHQLAMREITGPKETDRGPAVETLQTGADLKEVEVEVLYKNNPQLIPGRKVDLVAGFWKSSYWHIWGAADGASHSSQDFVVELPGTPNTHSYARAIKFLEAERERYAPAARENVAAIPVAEREVSDAWKKYQQGYGKPEQAAMEAAKQRLFDLKAPAAHVAVIDARVAELRQTLDAMTAAKAATRSAQR